MTTIPIQEIEGLKYISGYREMLKSLRPRAIGSVIFGVLAILVGFLAFQENALNIVLILIGVFLLFEGIWLIVKPNPKGLVLDGFALCLVGAWNIAVTVLSFMFGGREVGFWVVYGILQLYWGIKSFVGYYKFKKEYAQIPTQKDTQRLDEIISALVKINPSDSERIIQFKSGKQWKGELSENMAVFASVKRNDVIFANRDEVVFVNHGKKTFGKNIDISIHVGERTLGGEMPPESCQRIESWKNEKDNTVQ
jgi:uncharacterized membrane protein